jgi:hypothetical protein
VRVASGHSDGDDYPDTSAVSAAEREADVSPGPDMRQPSTISERLRPFSGGAAGPVLVSLSEEQRSIIEVLRSQEQGMTARQLQARLQWSGDGVQPWLDSLLERQLVARLNTIVPSYIYR